MPGEEPTYEFKRGIGWVPAPTEEAQVGILSYEGRNYKVTIVKRQPEITERGSHYPDPLMQDWWGDWENVLGQKVPAGFGWGLYSETQVDYTVITEPMPMIHEYVCPSCQSDNMNTNAHTPGSGTYNGYCNACGYHWSSNCGVITPL